ncbi:aspartate/glutamate racemase family protein [Streptomyces sp. NPDC032198]|uniref:aspartate/glutamate racemase family protein n=1 Tax=Streptomyces sp. NPDC032198 TaxID=3155127 RepID=UPI0033FFE059
MRVRRSKVRRGEPTSTTGSVSPDDLPSIHRPGQGSRAGLGSRHIPAAQCSDGVTKRVTPRGHGPDGHRPLIWADPTVPDRTEALLGRGPSPLSAMVTGVSWLAEGRATCVAMPCNTAHAYLDALRAHTDVPILDMVSAALEACRSLRPSVDRIGILATEGARLTRLYDVTGAWLDPHIIHVRPATQTHHVNRAIADVKQGGDTARARRERHRCGRR